MTQGSDHLQHWPAIGAYMGLSPHAVRHLSKTAGLPTYKIGKTVAASKASIDRWRAAREAAANPTEPDSPSDPTKPE